MNQVVYRGKRQCVFLVRRNSGLLLRVRVDPDTLDRMEDLGVRWQARWSPSAYTYYVQARLKGNSSPMTQLHRWIMGVEHTDHRKTVVDHANFCGLDNRRSNLRVVSRSGNQLHCRARSSNTSGYVGVTWEKYRKKWQAGVGYTQEGKRRYKFVGYFDSPVVASKARNKLAEEMFQREVR